MFRYLLLLLVFFFLLLDECFDSPGTQINLKISFVFVFTFFTIFYFFLQVMISAAEIRRKLGLLWVSHLSDYLNSAKGSNVLLFYLHKLLLGLSGETNSNISTNAKETSSNVNPKGLLCDIAALLITIPP